MTGGERGVDGVRGCNTGFVRRMVAGALASIDADEVREAKSFGVDVCDADPGWAVAVGAVARAAWCWESGIGW